MQTPALGWLTVIAVSVAGCGAGGSAAHTSTVRASEPAATPASTRSSHTRSTRVHARVAARVVVPRVLGAASATGPTNFVPAVTLGARPIAYVARSASGIALLSFDQRYVNLHLHSGTIDAGGTGWRYGPSVAGSELRRVVAGFNSGFKLDTAAGGFEEYGRTAVPLRNGLASVVSYADGYTDIGTWHQEVPGTGHGAVVSVRQNLTPLIDHGQAASSVGCVSCWGATLGGGAAVARSAIGITADGRLVWAGGQSLTAGALASALLGAHVVCAAELDINPEWVAAYLYSHRTTLRAPLPVPASPGQVGIPGELLTPDARDF
jgi:hypothetical protein